MRNGRRIGFALTMAAGAGAALGTALGDAAVGMGLGAAIFIAFAATGAGRRS